MRALTRTFVSATAVAGILVGSLAGASSSFATTGVATKPAVSTKEVSPLAVDNHGLNTTEARWVQCWLMDYWSYPGPLDGQLGTNSWKAMQRFLATYHGYTGNIDGDPGPNTNRALQRYLKSQWDYTDSIDGIFGPNSVAAFKRFAGWTAQFC